MSDLVFSASNLSGTITLPQTKSAIIRELLLNALSGSEPTRVVHLTDNVCDDIRHAYSACNYVKNYNSKCDTIEVGESATLLRLMVPVMLSKYGLVRFHVKPSLFNRPVSQFAESLECQIRYEGVDTLCFSDMKKKSLYTVDCSISSQFASGMLLALPFLPKSTMDVGEHTVSKPYFELTLQLMEGYGINIKKIGTKYQYDSGTFITPYALPSFPDFSYAANYIVANQFGSNVTFSNFCTDVIVPDSNITALLRQSVINISDTPDLFPILAVSACSKIGKTTFIGTKRLRTKESDRIAAVTNGIHALGGEAIVYDDYVEIHGHGNLHGGIIDSRSDHRIVMAFAIASLLCNGSVAILDADSVSKSAPQFFDDFIKLGGKIDEYIRP